MNWSTSTYIRLQIEIIVLAVLLHVVAGCEDTSKYAEPAPAYRPVIKFTSDDAPPPKRFEVDSYGYFRAGYQSNTREILIIKDKDTGNYYLAITGCGVTELHTELRGKFNAQVEE